MSGQWKPGAVAVITGEGNEWRAIVRPRKSHATEALEFAYVTGGFDIVGELAEGYSARPLVVIDPEDTEAVERFAKLYTSEGAGRQRGTIEALTWALREFANPTPPKCTASLFVTYGDGKGAEQRCDRAEGHEGPHVDGSFTWTAVQP